MFIRKTRFIEYQADQIADMQQEIRSLRELLEAKNKLISTQQNEIFTLERKNRALTNKVDSITERTQSAEASYG